MIALAWLLGCGPGPCMDGYGRTSAGACVPLGAEPQEALGGDDESVTLDLTVVATSEDGLFQPRDLEFSPLGDLWVVNADDAMVVLSDPGGMPTAARFSGPEARHWLARPSALAFGAPGLLATSHESLGDNTPPSNAIGPTLWPSDLADFDGGRPSHLDMVHDSPLSMGIAWEQDNEYWVHDGYNGCLTWYDFAEPHEPGGTDHGDARVVRYLEGTFGYVEDTPSHLAFDATLSNVLYFADTASQRVMALNTTSGGPLEWIAPTPTPPPHGDATPGRWRVSEADHWVVAEASVGLVAPSGLEVQDGLIWVTDPATSTVWVFTPEGEVADRQTFEELPAGSLAGLAFDDAGRLWLVDKQADRVLRVDPQE